MVTEYLNTNHAFSDFVRDFGITQEHMHKVAEALAKFVQITADQTTCHSVQEAVGQAGLLDLPQPILMVTFSLIAQGLLGRFWSLMRSSTLPELIVPTYSKEALLSGAEAMQKIFSKSSTSSKENMARDIKKWAQLPALPST